MSWIKQVLKATEEAESPTTFFYWSALSAISAVVMDNVYLVKGGLYSIYPNIYVMLVAKSGLRKGFPVEVAKSIVRSVENTRVISGHNSIQGIIKEMSYSESSNNGSVPIKHNNAFLCSGELSSFLINDPLSFTILTDLYDRNYNNVWKTTFKVAESAKLTNPTVTLLGASNPTHLSNFLDSASITGGLIARTLLVFADKKSRVNALVRKSNSKFEPEKLAEYLRIISKLRGEFRWENEAVIANYESWYKEWDKSIAAIDDNTGTLERIHDTIIKVAMLISLSESPEMSIKSEHLEEAINVCLTTTRHVRRILVAKGGGVESERRKQTEIIMTELINAGKDGIERSKLISKNYGSFDSIDLDRVLDTLFEANAIELRNSAGKTHYNLKSFVLEEYSKLKDQES